VRVLHTPDWRSSNPYQALLAEALAAHGVTSCFTTGLRVLPLLREVARHRPDIVHVHAAEAYLLDPRLVGTLLRAVRLLAEALWLRLRGVPVVYTMHNLISQQRPHPRIERWATGAFLRLCHGIILHGASGMQSVREWFGESVAERCRVVLHGHFIDPNLPVPARPEARRALAVPPGTRLLVILGQILSYKMVLETIEIARGLPDAGFRLLVAGECREEGLRERLEEAAAGDERIRLELSFVPEEHVSAYLAAADVVLVPYRYIFTSGSLILAMSHGRPVLISDTGLVRDYIGEEGAFLFEAGDREALAGAIGRALSASERELERMGVANLERARSLDWATAARKTLAIYEEALGRGSLRKDLRMGHP